MVSGGSGSDNQATIGTGKDAKPEFKSDLSLLQQVVLRPDNSDLQNRQVRNRIAGPEQVVDI